LGTGMGFGTVFDSAKPNKASRNCSLGSAVFRRYCFDWSACIKGGEKLFVFFVRPRAPGVAGQ